MRSVDSAFGAEFNVFNMQVLGDLWLLSESVPIPLQGWKIHVSITPENLHPVFCSLKPLLKDESFKVARSSAVVAALNAGHHGRRVMGKALTIYTTSESHFSDLAPTVHRQLMGQWGPPILTDRRFCEGSCVYYRYGSNGGSVRGIDRWGRRWSILQSPDRKIVADNPTEQWPIPDWLDDPFLSHSQAGSELTLPDVGSLGLSTTDILGNGSRLVFRAIGNGEESYVIKAAHLKSTHDLERNAYEISVARRLKGKGLVPELIELADVDSWNLAIYEDSGTDLRHHHLRGGEDESWLDQLLSLVEGFHAEGWVMGDLSPANVACSTMGLRYIDLEHAVPMGLTSPSMGATPGYEGPHSLGHWRQDLAAAGRVALHAWSGLDMRVVPQISSDEVQLLLTGASSGFISKVSKTLSNRAPSAHLIRRMDVGSGIASIDKSYNGNVGLRCRGGNVLVKGVVSALVAEARSNNGTWPSAGKGINYARDTLAGGDLGPAWLLLHECTPGEEGFAIACNALNRARYRRDMGQDGLYAGPFGYLLAEFIRGFRAGETDRVGRAVDELIAACNSPFSQLDVLGGFSGRLAVLSQASACVNDPRLQEARSICANRLLSALIIDEKDLLRQVGQGAAGILGIVRVLRNAFDGEISDTHIARIENSAIRALASKLATRDASWCKGAAGLGIHLMSCLHQRNYEDTMTLLGLVVQSLHRAPLPNLGLCHGLAGVFRCAALAATLRVEGSQEVLAACHSIFSATAVKVHGGVSWLNSHGEIEASFLNGSSGIAYVLSKVDKCIPPYLPHEEISCSDHVY